MYMKEEVGKKEENLSWKNIGEGRIGDEVMKDVEIERRIEKNEFGGINIWIDVRENGLNKMEIGNRIEELIEIKRIGKSIGKNKLGG